MLDARHPLDDRAHAAAAARALDASTFDEQALKRYDVGEAASVVSAIPEVREALCGVPAKISQRIRPAPCSMGATSAR